MANGIQPMIVNSERRLSSVSFLEFSQLIIPKPLRPVLTLDLKGTCFAEGVWWEGHIRSEKVMKDMMLYSR